MIYPEKTVTDNPFVDNILYYAKYLALNGTVKDEDEALNNETKETLEAGDMLISSVEGTARYEIFKYIPREILEKYIPIETNLDLYIRNPSSLNTYYNHFSDTTRQMITNKLNELARAVYIDHYLILTGFLINQATIDETQWLNDNLELFNNCNNNTATYEDLFDKIPIETLKRIISRYIINYDSYNINYISSSLDVFNNYISTRDEDSLGIEISNMTEAMSDVFISHYKIIQERIDIREYLNYWSSFSFDEITYKKCKNRMLQFEDLYDILNNEKSKRKVLIDILGKDIVENWFADDITIVNIEAYLYSLNNDIQSDNIKSQLTNYLINKYIESYPLYSKINTYIDIYQKCSFKKIDFIGLMEYLPKETSKMILKTQVNEIINLDVFSKEKKILDSYLNTLPDEKSSKIKTNIAADMREWYPKNHKEYNNYYRTFLGLPPIINNIVCKDSLIQTWNAKINQFINFGNKFINMIPNDIYNLYSEPEIHWTKPLYELSKYDIGILNHYGILDAYVTECQSNYYDSRYKYINYLETPLDIYQCRRAERFQLIGLPYCEDSEAKKKFSDLYSLNREYVLKTVYSEAYKFKSDYYNKFIIIFIILNTIMDMLSGITSLIINRDVLDDRCVKYLFESFGIPYFSEIPIKYLKAMLKNLNLLLKYKSSTKNMIDICNLFGFSDVKVFGYYLFKERKIDGSGEYSLDEDNPIYYINNDLKYIKNPNGSEIDIYGERYTKLDPSNPDHEKYFTIIYTDDKNYPSVITKTSKDIYIKNVVTDAETGEDYLVFDNLLDTQYFTKVKANTKPYELKFIKYTAGDDLAKYKSDPNYILSYDDITLNDKGNTWDGGEDHNSLYNKLLKEEFNAVKTKYISVESIVDLSKQSLEISYFFNLLLDNLYSEDNLTLDIPIIKSDHKFRFTDIFLYLYALMYFYNGLEDNIISSPTQILYVNGYNLNDIVNEIEESENEDKNYKVKSFNINADMKEIDTWLNTEYGLTLDDFIIDENNTTLRSFYSLNNDYYKSFIFNNNLVAFDINEIIDTSYYMKALRKKIIDDLDKISHAYIKYEDLNNKKYIEVINIQLEELYLKDNNKYIVFPNGEKHAIYNKYIKDGLNYQLLVNEYYYYNSDISDFERILNNEIYINKDNLYIFSTNAIYVKDSDDYSLLTNEEYFYTDDNRLKCFKFDLYYIQNEDGSWGINYSNIYIKVTINGEEVYKPYNTIYEHNNPIITENQLWVKHSDGHFINFSDTDFYRPEIIDDINNNNYNYTEEDLYIEVDYETDESDTTIDGEIKYFKKLNDYINEEIWSYDLSQYYITDHGTLLIPPTNLYYIDNDEYKQIINNFYKYIEYDNEDNINASSIIILNENGIYNKFDFDQDNNLILDQEFYIESLSNRKLFIYDYDNNYIIFSDLTKTYNDSQSYGIFFKKTIITPTYEELLIDTNEYDPEVTDKVWDENDWFYKNDLYSNNSNKYIGKNGENIWYYTNLNGETNVPDEDQEQEINIGAGFYISADSYLGENQLKENEEYYISFDIESNFDTEITIFNQADSNVIESNGNISFLNNINRKYFIKKDNKIHIFQIFNAKQIENPQIKFLMYNFKRYPINFGNYIIISNMKIIKSNNINNIYNDISNLKEFANLYRTNMDIYKYIVKCMNEATDIKTYKLYKKLYDSLLLSEYNKDLFKKEDGTYYKTYTEFIKSRDSVLYENLIRFKNLDKDSMTKEIANHVIDITEVLNEYLDNYDFKFIYSYLPGVSVNYIEQYISKVIDWFKSWKVHFLGMSTVYKFGSNDLDNENHIKILENQNYKYKLDSIFGNAYIHDTIKINPLEDSDIRGIKYMDKENWAEYFYNEDTIDYNFIPTFSKKDNYRVKDRIRLIIKAEDHIEYKDRENELHLILKDDRINISIEDENNLHIKSSDSGFRNDDNKLIMSSDMTSEFALETYQFLSQINKFSNEYIDWSDLLNE